MELLVKHKAYYISLIAILALGAVLFFLISSDRALQMAVLAAMVLFYVAWGILHHHVNHDLTIKIMLEYVLIGLLGFLVVVFLLKGVHV